MQFAAFVSAWSALSAGEYTSKLTQSIYTEETPISPADLADLRRQTTKQQNSLNLKQSVFLCVIMQPAAFLCVICAICGRIHIQTYSIYIVHIKPQCLSQITQIIADKQQNIRTSIPQNIKPQQPHELPRAHAHRVLKNTSVEVSLHWLSTQYVSNFHYWSD